MHCPELGFLFHVMCGVPNVYINWYRPEVS